MLSRSSVIILLSGACLFFFIIQWEVQSPPRLTAISVDVKENPYSKIFKLFKITDKASDCVQNLSRRMVPDGRRKRRNHTYLEIYNTLYKPRNYLIQGNCTTHPWLGLENKNQYKPDYCKVVYKEWIEGNKVKPVYPPPKLIPPDLLSNYTLGGILEVSKWYLDNVSSKNHFVWDKKKIDQALGAVKARKNFYYGQDTQILYSAMDTINLTGKVAAVIGTLEPWIEAIILSRNASHVVTIEYSQIDSSDPRVSAEYPMDVANKFVNGTQPLYDFIASFSSLEHSGLGRYGDVVDPFGDIKEMQKCWCLLKPGGMMLIGFPLGRDHLSWNAHRYFGPYRLPMMTAGFKVVNIFGFKKEPMDWRSLKDNEWIFDYALGGHSQRVIILRKLT